MRKAYNQKEHQIICEAYVKLAKAEIAGVKLSKAQTVRDVMAQCPDRTRGAIEAKFMNISHVVKMNGLFPELALGYVKGYKPAPNGAKALLDCIKEALGFTAQPVVKLVGFSVTKERETNHVS